MKWFRDRTRQLAGEGRTILVSSHLLTEAAFYVDHVVILDRGQARVGDRLESLVGAATASTPVNIVAVAADREALLAALTQAGMDARPRHEEGS